MELPMRRNHNRAFTAIEMLFVLALMAIVAAGASLSLVGVQRNSDMAAVIDRLRYFDDLTRRQAARTGRPLELVFDAGGVRRVDPAEALDDSPLAALQLPDGVAIDAVKIAGASQESVPISPSGLSPTYAILLDRRGQRVWMIVSILGEARQAADDGTIEYEMDQLQ